MKKIVFGILASTNEHYTEFLEIWIENIKKFTYNDKVSSEIWKITGPEFFTQYLNPHLSNPLYKFYDIKYFYPYWWLETERRNEDFNITSPESYSVHH